MPLPVPEVERELTHTRRVRYEGYKRADGLWDIEAHLLDTKNHDYPLKTGVRRAGQAIHEMALRISIDRSFTVVEALAASDAVPYPGGCETIAPAYRKLVGLNLLRGFRKQAADAAELLAGLPTAAIQTFAGEMKEERADGAKPFQLDRCHALETTTETVRRWYPQWYRSKRSSEAA